MISSGQDVLIDGAALDVVNGVLGDPSNPLVEGLARVVERYGSAERINAQAREARELPRIFDRLREMGSPYLADLEWLEEQRRAGAFVGLDAYYRGVLGDTPSPEALKTAFPVTLEISAIQYFPWLIDEAREAIAEQNLMPGRYIRVRRMREAEADQGDLLALAAGMQIVGASYVETLDTRGTDGSNLHLGGAGTLAGYFGGVGQPNDYPLKWADEFLYYYTNYGVQQVLNANQGTMLVAFLLHRMGIDIEFKISVLLGMDNAYSVFLALMCARLFARPDGSTPLIGLNFSNSADNATIEQAAGLRRALGFEERVRFEVHVNQAWKGIVRQPFLRRDEVVALAATVPNISAKHEGGELEVEQAREYPSDLLDYFREKADIEEAGYMAVLADSYLDRHRSINLTAERLVRAGVPVVAARNLH